MCLKDVVLLLANGNVSHCMYLGEVKSRGSHYKLNFVVDLVLLGANKKTTLRPSCMQQQDALRLAGTKVAVRHIKLTMANSATIY